MERAAPGKALLKGARARDLAERFSSELQKKKANGTKMIDMPGLFEKRAAPGKALRKGARVRALAGRSSSELQKKKVNERNMIDTPELFEKSTTKEEQEKAGDAKKTENILRYVPRYKLRRGGKVFRTEFLLKRLQRISLTMGEE